MDYFFCVETLCWTAVVFIKDEVNCITELLKSPTYLYSAQKSLVMLFWLIIHAVLIIAIGFVHYVVGKPAPLQQDTRHVYGLCIYGLSNTAKCVGKAPPKMYQNSYNRKRMFQY